MVGITPMKHPCTQNKNYRFIPAKLKCSTVCLTAMNFLHSSTQVPAPKRRKQDLVPALSSAPPSLDGRTSVTCQREGASSRPRSVPFIQIQNFSELLENIQSIEVDGLFQIRLFASLVPVVLYPDSPVSHFYHFDT